MNLLNRVPSVCGFVNSFISPGCLVNSCLWYLENILYILSFLKMFYVVYVPLPVLEIQQRSLIGRQLLWFNKCLKFERTDGAFWTSSPTPPNKIVPLSWCGGESNSEVSSLLHIKTINAVASTKPQSFIWAPCFVFQTSTKGERQTGFLVFYHLQKSSHFSILSNWNGSFSWTVPTVKRESHSMLWCYTMFEKRTCTNELYLQKEEQTVFDQPCSCTLFSGLCTRTELTESRLS